MRSDDLDPALEPADRDQLLQMAAQLQAGRPSPPPGFRGDLGRAVAQDERRRHLRPRPAHLWAKVAALAAAGAALLALAATQL